LIVIDTSALIAIFRLEPEADALLHAIVTAEKRAMSALSVLEASMVMSGRGEAAASFEALDEFLLEAGIEIVPFDAGQALIAGEAFQRFGRGRHKAGLNLGDCASYAVAKARAAPLLYKGGDFSHTDLASVIR
jgi:ribonuclease VapC